MQGFCAKEDYEDLLEKLVRGKCLQAKNQFSNIFKENFIQQMATADCLGPLDEIVIEKLQAAFIVGDLDVNALSASFGRE